MPPHCDLPPLSISATVNLIDDDSADRDVPGEYLRSMGFHTKLYRTHEQFLRADNSARPACVLADLEGRVQDGFAVLRALNAGEDPLPAVFVVSRASIADAVSLMQAGAVSLLEEPYCKRSLLSAVESAVRLDAQRRMVSAQRRRLQLRLERLSDEEIPVLHELVAGKTNKSIAAQLRVALRTVEYRRHKIFEKLEVQSVAEMTAVVTELERLTDVSALLNASPARLAGSRFASLCVPGRMRTTGAARPIVDPPHAGPPEPLWSSGPVRSSVGN